MTNYRKRSLCGCCNKNINKSDKSLLCRGKCKIWHHINCVNVTDSDFDMIIALKGKILWFCDSCKQTLELNVSEDFVVSTDTEETVLRLDEANTDVYSVLFTDQMSQISSRLNDMDLRINKLESENLNLKTALNSQAEALSDVLTGDNKSYANKVKNGRPLDGRNVVHCRPTNMDLKLTPASVESLGNKPSNNENSSDDFQLVLKRNRNNTKKPSNHMSKENVNADRGRKGFRKSNMFITGTGNVSADNNLKTVNKKEFLFVSRLDPSTKKEELVNYLKNKLNEDVVVEQLTSRYPALYSSFKIGISETNLQPAFTPSFWPNGVFVNKFVTSRRSLNLKNKVGEQKT